MKTRIYAALAVKELNLDMSKMKLDVNRKKEVPLNLSKIGVGLRKRLSLISG